MSTIRVHRNLNRACWSVTRPGARVAHVEAIQLEGATFVVQPGGRARVLRTGVRAVHAYAKGMEAHPADIPPGAVRVTYNPFRAPTFTTETGSPVVRADRVLFLPDGRCVAVNPS